MNDEWYQYDSIAVHTTPTPFHDWLQGYLQTTLPGNVFLRDFYSGNERYFGYVAMKAFEIHVEVTHKTPEDIQFTFWANKQTQQVKTHIHAVIQAINNKWTPAALPHGFINLIKDTKMVKVFEQRWDECSRTIQAEAYFSTVILLGSILEGVLYYKIKENFTEASKSTYAHKNGKVIQITSNLWGLERLIKVANDRGWLSQGIMYYNEIIRNYRNLIHPTKFMQYPQYTFNAPLCKTLMNVVHGSIEELVKQ